LRILSSFSCTFYLEKYIHHPEDTYPLFIDTNSI
jgi:hypothetical protein